MCRGMVFIFIKILFIYFLKTLIGLWLYAGEPYWIYGDIQNLGDPCKEGLYMA